MFFVRREINTSTLSLSNNSHELRIHTSSLALAADVIKGYWCATGNTARPLAIDCAILWLASARFYAKTNGRRGHGMIHVRLYPCLFAFLFREVERAHQRHFCATGWIRTGYRPCPQPGNYY